jgi:uncharacterized OsmC-like protein
MAVTMTLTYDGDLRTTVVHDPSRSMVGTDAPKDNEGKGELFSPTDLVGAALLSCAVTTMAIKGPKAGVPFLHCKGSVVKSMTTSPPRKIDQLAVDIELPPGLTPEQRATLEHMARTCPVALSLSADIKVDMRFR